MDDPFWFRNYIPENATLDPDAPERTTRDVVEDYIKFMLWLNEAYLELNVSSARLEEKLRIDLIQFAVCVAAVSKEQISWSQVEAINDATGFRFSTPDSMENYLVDQNLFERLLSSKPVAVQLMDALREDYADQLNQLEASNDFEFQAMLSGVLFLAYDVVGAQVDPDYYANENEFGYCYSIYLSKLLEWTRPHGENS